MAWLPGWTNIQTFISWMLI